MNDYQLMKKHFPLVNWTDQLAINMVKDIKRQLDDSLDQNFGNQFSNDHINLIKTLQNNLTIDHTALMASSIAKGMEGEVRAEQAYLIACELSAVAYSIDIFGRHKFISLLKKNRKPPTQYRGQTNWSYVGLVRGTREAWSMGTGYFAVASYKDGEPYCKFLQDCFTHFDVKGASVRSALNSWRNQEKAAGRTIPRGNSQSKSSLAGVWMRLGT